jgi:two-component system, OmpR family, alkaline phosphatase synthesis response regulator PhoP
MREACMMPTPKKASTVAKKQILVVDDERDILDLVKYNFEREGWVVHCVTDGEQALRTVRKATPDLVVLDVMLPGVDGVEVCRALRSDDRTRTVPIVMLTAKSEEADAVLGLGVGADDYVKKPFGVKELVARVKALLRRESRAVESDESSLVRVRNLTIDSVRHEVTVRGEPVQLTLTEFRLLRALAAKPGRVYTRAELIDKAMGQDVVVIDRNVDVHVRALRKKLGAAADDILTVRGIGYKFRE